MPLAVIQPAASTLSMIHTDRLGTPQRATNASKTIVFSADYDPNGKTTPTTTINQNLRLPWMFADGTGLYHNSARDYIPDYLKPGGRYLQTDPIGLNGGINTYVYGLNNTGKYTDPSGLVPNPLETACLAGPNPVCGAGIAADVITTVGGLALGTGIAIEVLQLINKNENPDDSTTEPQNCPPPDDLMGKTPEEVDEMMKSKGWQGESSKRGGGTRYPNPGVPGEQVRVQPGNPNDPNPVKKGPYGRISSKGKVSAPIPLSGNPTLPR